MNTPADVVIVGMGAVGGIVAKELTSAGLKVVGLERGPLQDIQDYAYKDSIRAIPRRSLEEPVRHEPITIRPSTKSPTTLRHTMSPANSVGGALMHWTGQASRFTPGDFKVYTNEVQSGLAERAGADLTGYDVVDWPITYDDLEPYYERFEWEMGVSGKGGVNPFAGPRNRDYPVPPLRRSAKSKLFAEATERLGYHPYDTPSGILSQAYKPPPPFDQRIPERQACVYCGHCHNYGCHVQARTASPFTVLPVALETGNLDLRTHCKVFRINTDAAGRATGVSYFDEEGNVQEQQASVVILGAFLYEHVRLLLLSKTDDERHRRGLANSSGMVGRYIMAHGDARAYGAFDDYIINGFIGPGSATTRIDDFNGNNFDHEGLGFIRGGTIGASGGGSPLERYNDLAPDVPTWGKEYKEYMAHYYTRTFDLNMQPETLPHKHNHVDLDPVRKDEWGIPLPRVTFTFHQNEQRIARYLTKVGEGIMKEAGADRVWSGVARTGNRWAGGIRMGADPTTSVVNGYCQAHDVENLFMVGSSVFPTMAGYPPTDTVAALAYRTAEHIAGRRELFA